MNKAFNKIFFQHIIDNCASTFYDEMFEEYGNTSQFSIWCREYKEGTFDDFDDDSIINSQNEMLLHFILQLINISSMNDDHSLISKQIVKKTVYLAGTPYYIRQFYENIKNHTEVFRFLQYIVDEFQQTNEFNETYLNCFFNTKMFLDTIQEWYKKVSLNKIYESFEESHGINFLEERYDMDVELFYEHDNYGKVICPECVQDGGIYSKGRHCVDSYYYNNYGTKLNLSDLNFNDIRRIVLAKNIYEMPLPVEKYNAVANRCEIVKDIMDRVRNYL
jgi:hypothetical protein